MIFKVSKVSENPALSENKKRTVNVILTVSYAPGKPVRNVLWLTYRGISINLINNGIGNCISDRMALLK